METTVEKVLQMSDKTISIISPVTTGQLIPVSWPMGEPVVANEHFVVETKHIVWFLYWPFMVSIIIIV